MIVQTVNALSRRLNQLSGFLAMMLILYLLTHILLEIILRQFGTSTYVLDEFVGYAVATSTFLGLGYSLEKGSLIKVNLLKENLSEKYHWINDVFISLSSLIFFSWLAYYWYKNVKRSYMRGITSESIAETPLWIPEGMVLFGLIILCITLLSRSLSLITTRKPPPTGTEQ